MAKKKENSTCGTCQGWRGTDKDFNNCNSLVNGKDVRISGHRLQTHMSFGCNKYKGKEVNNDTVPSGDTPNSTID